MVAIRTLLAVEHPLARVGVSTILADAPDIAIVAETGDRNSIGRLLLQYRPEVLLIGLDGAPAQLAELLDQTERLPIKVVVLAATTRAHTLCLSGSVSWILYAAAPTVLAQTIRRVARSLNGDEWLQRAHTHATPRMNPTAEPLAQTDLTERELMVTRLIANGRTNQQVGIALGISEKTVQKHLRQIFTKLGAASRVEVAVWAVREKLV